MAAAKPLQQEFPLAQFPLLLVIPTYFNYFALLFNLSEGEFPRIQEKMSHRFKGNFLQTPPAKMPQ